MKKTILISFVSILCFQSFGQMVNFNPMDSTLLYTDRNSSGVQRFNKLTPVYVQNLSRVDSSGKLKMLVVDTTRAAVGLRSVYWIDIPAGGSGGGGGGTPGGSNKQFQYNNSSSFGGSGNLKQETNYVRIDATDTGTPPLQLFAMSGQTAALFKAFNAAGDSIMALEQNGDLRVGNSAGARYSRRVEVLTAIADPSINGLFITDIANGNSVGLWPSFGNYLSIYGGGVKATAWLNPSTGNTLTSSPWGFYTTGGDKFGANGSPVSTLDASGSLGAAITTTTSNLTLTDAHYTVIVTSGTPTITLPTASGCTRRIYVVVNQTGSAVTVSTYKDFGGSDATTIAANGSHTFQSNGTNWYRIQ